MGIRSVVVASFVGSAAAGFSCPANGGCATPPCTGQDWEEWVGSHNIFRCMHDVSAVSWSNPVAADAVTTFKNQKQMQHSECYKVKPPAGPAGENLFWGSGSWSAWDAVQSWYSEVTDCGSVPTCAKKTGTVGHYTAEVWAGVQTIGCTSNAYGIKACRYKAGDTLDNNVPNMQGGEAKNLFARTKTFKNCKATVAACKLKVAAGASKVNDVTGLVEIQDPVLLSTSTWAMAIMASGFAALAVGFTRFWRSRPLAALLFSLVGTRASLFFLFCFSLLVFVACFALFVSFFFLSLGCFLV
jgi:hypothetical protein